MTILAGVSTTVESISNNNMHIAILTSIISSSTLSAIITFLITYFTNRRNKRIEHEFDFRKYILCKRQNAYDDLEKIIVRLGNKKINLKTGKPIHTLFTETNSEMNPIVDIITCIINVSNKHTFWITKEIDDYLVELIQFLGSYNKFADNENSISLRKLEELAAENYIKVEEIRVKIYNQFFIDIKQLENVEFYIDSKKHF